jgi:hypothetical protein
MSYRIVYADSGKRHSARLPVLTAVCFLCFILLVQELWPEGKQTLRSLAHAPAEWAPAAALDRFARELVRGEPVNEAFANFLGISDP